ncbi:MAG: hypothetical protein MZV70_45495 [Desulfobacterales bacterium]|nr:hypothetical protein [Desulfobacterales bacterium]
MEDVPAGDVKKFRDSGHLSATTDFARAAAGDGRDQRLRADAARARRRTPTMSFIVHAVEDIKKRLRAGQLVILGSTTYPGTTHELFAADPRGRAASRSASTSPVAFAPERVDPGQPVASQTRNMPKVVGGMRPPRCTDLGAGVCPAKVFDTVVPVSRLHRGRRDGQAAREHLPRDQHRPGQRAGADVRQARASTSGR